MLFASFGSLYCGYTLAVIISTLGQPTFYSSLGLVTDPTDPGYGFTNAVISTANGIFFAGAFSGALVAGALSSKLGRIRIFQMSSIVGIIGGAIQTGAISAAMVRSPTRGKIEMLIGAIVLGRTIYHWTWHGSVFCSCSSLGLGGKIWPVT